MPVSAWMMFSSPMSCAPPPVMTMPRSMMSAASSGGVLSSVTFTASTIAAVGSSMASRISNVEITITLRETTYEVASADLRVDLLFQRPRARELHLHFFSGALTERERVLALHEVDDRFVELVTTDAARLAHHDAAERDHRDFGGATADVDDHVPGWFVHRRGRGWR